MEEGEGRFIGFGSAGLGLYINHQSAPLAIAVARDFAASKLDKGVGHGIGFNFADTAEQHPFSGCSLDQRCGFEQHRGQDVCADNVRWHRPVYKSLR